MKKILTTIIALALLIYAYGPISSQATTYEQHIDELRGVWVSTVFNIDIKKQN